MDKKKKIIIGSITIIILIGVIVLGTTSNNKNNVDNNNQVSDSNDEESTNNEESNANKGEDDVIKEGEILEEDKPENQKDPEPPIGVSITEFENSLVNLGYEKFEDKEYDLFSNGESLVFLQILDNEVKMSIKGKDKIENETIVNTIKLLIPDSYDTVIKYVKESSDEIGMSLDNRTVGIRFGEDGELVVSFIG